MRLNSVLKRVCTFAIATVISSSTLAACEAASHRPVQTGAVQATGIAAQPVQPVTVQVTSPRVQGLSVGNPYLTADVTVQAQGRMNQFVYVTTSPCRYGALLLTFGDASGVSLYRRSEHSCPQGADRSEVAMIIGPGDSTTATIDLDLAPIAGRLQSGEAYTLQASVFFALPGWDVSGGAAKCSRRVSRQQRVGPLHRVKSLRVRYPAAVRRWQGRLC